MINPKISWQVLESISEDDPESEYIQYKTYTEEGSFIPGEYITKSFRIWNNFNGRTDVNDAKDAVLVMAFKNFEDNFLLNLMSVTIDNKTFNDLEIDIDRAIVEIGTLSGIANSGSDINESNYKDITLSLGPIPENIKSDLKSLYLYLEFTNE
jgi:hypothetical protein